MSLFTRFVRINIAMLIFVSTALADVPEELRNLVLTGDIYGRSSVDFTAKATDPKTNVTTLVPKGTRGTVLEVRKLAKTHSFGIKLKVTDLSKKPSNSKNAVTKDQEVWVYFSSTKANWLKFRDADGSVVQDPEVALTAQAKRDGEALPAVPGTLRNPTLPTADEVKREAAQSDDPNEGKKDRGLPEGDWCPLTPCPGSVQSVSDKNFQQVEETMNALAPFDNSHKAKAPTITLSEQPVKKESLPERPISRTPKTEQVHTPGKWGQFPEITEWENGPGQKLATRALKTAKGFSGACYHKFKRDPIATGLVHTYLPGGHARDGVRDLLNLNKKKSKKDSGYEWVNLLDDPRYKGMIKSPTDVPHGAVVVSWNGERSSSGDIQVRNARPPKVGWASDGWSQNTINNQPAGRHAARRGKPYKMTGVMVKIKKPTGENL